MTTSSDPDEIRAEIERTRASLSDNVDALADEANPKNIARRQVDKVKDAGVGLKDRIMGSAADAVDSAKDSVAGLTSSASDKASVAGDRVSGAGDLVAGTPGAAKRKTQGNPLAAGVREQRVRPDDAGDRQAELGLGIVDRVAADDRAAGRGARVGPAAQDLREHVGPERVQWIGDEVEGAHRLGTHRVDVRQRVGRRDAAERVRVVDDGSEEVGGVDERELGRELDHPGVVGGRRAGQHARVIGHGQGGDDRRELRRADLAAAAGAVGERGQGGERHASYIPLAVPFSDAEVDAAVQRLSEPGRLDAAQRTVGAQAPALQRILNQALEDANWFGPAHADEVRKATHAEDPETAVRSLVAEETRVAMLIGAAVGLELANLLANPTEE